MLTVNQILQNRYRIEAQLGQGGMGAVYRAYDLRLQRVCVVKELLLQSGMTQNLSDAAAQFFQEARTLSNLHHPSIPRVIDYFDESGAYFLVMDFMTGVNLGNMIGTGLPEALVLKYADQLLDVLDYIHHQGVLHRDIKPANIIIQPDGRAVLVDFGLVKSFSGTTQLTKPFLRGIGTPEYAPPEQYGGGTDQRSDIYSLGGTLYNALTGQVPVSATNQIAGAPLVPPRQIGIAVSPNTERAILKALSLNPAQRFQSAAEFRAALRGTQGTSQQRTAVVTPAIQATAPIRASGNNRLTIVAIIGAIVVVVAGLFIIANLGQPAPATIVNTARPLTIAPVPTNSAAQPSSPTLAATAEEHTITDTPQPTDMLAIVPTSADTPTSTPSPTPSSTPTPTPSPTPVKPTCQTGRAEITSPLSGQVLKGIVTVMGTASCDGFAFYKFEFIDARCNKGRCFVAGEFRKPVENGVLMQWDTRKTWDGQPMPNDTFVLRMTVMGKPSPLGNVLPVAPEIRITIDNR